MSKRISLIAIIFAILSAGLSFQKASAHTSVRVGNYDVEIGWIDEPPIVGQRNAVVVNVTNTTNTTGKVNVSNLTVDVTYGGQTRTLILQPLAEDTLNQYVAPLLPTIPGQYTVQLRGQLDTTNINQDVQPEEVVPADILAFPTTTPSQANSSITWSEWLSVIAMIAGVAGFGLALLAFRKSR